ncbi:MAG: aspartate-semialdehyde dehydrogenase, partial [Planctomycetes bacterium]|nr:aspartate-semialdehyde dehydrogenase [Planctomycetota bacterium]
MKVAVAGATGAVGIEFLRILEERKFPVDALRLLASSRSAGKKLAFRGEEFPVEDLSAFDPRGTELALFSAGSAAAKEHAPRFARAGAVVVDNSSAFRMDPEVPLVVPEINPEDARRHQGIVANPNCTTILFLMAVFPLHREAGIRRAIVSTYQAVSGKGARAMEELDLQIRAAIEGKPLVSSVFPHPIAGNVIPQVDSFDEEGTSIEERKLSRETAKILGANAFAVAGTCVRVPVPRAHSESVALEFEREIDPERARRLLSSFPGVRVVDDPSRSVYPM